MIQPATPNDSKAMGLSRYFTGQPCRHGHVAERITSSRGCVVCSFDRATAWKIKNREQATQSSKAWRHKNPDRVKAVKAAWGKANPEGQAKRSRGWYLANKEKADAATARWRENNLDIACASQARRRAKKVSQTPVWADHRKIKSVYAEAKRLTQEFGAPYHVDHIVPLQSGLVTGLHVESNLQILPATNNRSKGNRHWPDAF